MHSAHPQFPFVFATTWNGKRSSALVLKSLFLILFLPIGFRGIVVTVVLNLSLIGWHFE